MERLLDGSDEEFNRCLKKSTGLVRTRAIKQVCNIEHFQVRSKIAILNHIFAAICGYVHLQKLCALDVIANCYRLQRDLFQEVIAAFIHDFVVDKNHLYSQFSKAINA